MARLVHNDYLEQASDSGIPGFLLYTALIAIGLTVAFKAIGGRGDWETFAIWLGLFGWAMQSMVEFSLYIPALAWPAFTLLGWAIMRQRWGAGLESTK
jgi:O-antigen ligase